MCIFTGDYEYGVQKGKFTRKRTGQQRGVDMVELSHQPARPIRFHEDPADGMPRPREYSGIRAYYPKHTRQREYATAPHGQTTRFDEAPFAPQYGSTSKLPTASYRELSTSHHGSGNSRSPEYDSNLNADFKRASGHNQRLNYPPPAMATQRRDPQYGPPQSYQGGSRAAPLDVPGNTGYHPTGRQRGTSVSRSGPAMQRRPSRRATLYSGQCVTVVQDSKVN
ncbi:MAG: hypothetical protein Q9228_005096 [Teloschistes exilis]